MICDPRCEAPGSGMDPALPGGQGMHLPYKTGGSRHVDEVTGYFRMRE